MDPCLYSQLKFVDHAYFLITELKNCLHSIQITVDLPYIIFIDFYLDYCITSIHCTNILAATSIISSHNSNKYVTKDS